jgi:hypothetical protein
MAEPWASLKRQSLGRSLSSAEMALASNLEAIFVDGVSDFDEVARRLTAKGVSAPSANTTAWTRALLEQELSLINRSLDEAYARGKSGA